MKYLLVLILCLSVCVDLMGQKVISETRHFQLGPYCEGAPFVIGDKDEISCFEITTGKCGSPVEYKAVDKSSDIKIQGPGLVSSDVMFEYSLDGKNKIKRMSYKFRAIRSGEIKVTSQSPINIDIPEGCNDPEESYIKETIWIFSLEVIPVPKPDLTAERFIAAGNILFMPSGCPVENVGYRYEVNSVLCLEKANDRFEPLNLNEKRGFEGYSNVNYRVRCVALGGQCVSEPSEFKMGLNYNPPDAACIPDNIEEQIAAIENQKQFNENGDKHLTYHVFPVSTKICSSVEKDCTADNIYKIMISENQFVTPIPSDLPGIDLFDMDNYYKPMNLPVKSCDIVKLPALLGEAILRLVQYPPQFALRNPVMTYLDAPNRVEINYTLKEHLFAPGRVIRRVVELCDGVYILTIGEGLSNNFLGIGIALLNEYFGEKLFKKIDQRVIERFHESK